MRRLLVLSSLLFACTELGDGEPASAEQPARTVDTRDQYALLADIEAALGNTLQPDPSTIAAVRRAWLGQRIRWELALVPIFCREAAACNVAPFDHARRPGRRIEQGWLPRLALDPAGFAALQSACVTHTQCVIEVEADITAFTFSPEDPTSLELGAVNILGTRASTPGESWIATPIRRQRA